MSRKRLLWILIPTGILCLAIIVLWPLGYRRQLRSWWYWRNGPHHGRFQDPEGLAIDAKGVFYVGDEKRSQILLLDPSGATLMTLKDIEGYPGPISTGNRMAIIEPGRFFVLGCKDDVVEIKIEEGKARALRSFTASAAPGKPPFAPEGMAFDPISRELYVTDEDGQRIVIFDQAGRVARTFPVDHLPEAIHLFEDRIFVSMPKVGWVSCYGRDGGFKFKFGEARFVQPETPIVSPDRKIYVSDNKGHKIEVFDLEGRHFFTLGGPGKEPGRFDRPQDLVFTPEGNLVVSDSNNHRLQVLTPAGAALRIFE
jgi:DNA-binding beta-propeller fold protein YncE